MNVTTLSLASMSLNRFPQKRFWFVFKSIRKGHLIFLLFGGHLQSLYTNVGTVTYIKPLPSIIIIISIQPEGRFLAGTRAQSGDRYGSGTLHSGSFLGVGCHCFPPPLDVPTFASRCLHVQATWETSISERRNYGQEMAGQFCLWFRLPRKPRVLWHAAQICDMGDGFTSPPRKACCGFFGPKNPTASAGI